MHCPSLTVGKLAIKDLCIYHSRRAALALVDKQHLRARAAELLFTLRHGEQALVLALLLVKHGSSSPLPALQREQARPRALARLGGQEGRLPVQPHPLARGRPLAPVSLRIRALLFAPAQRLTQARLLAQARLSGRVRLLVQDRPLSRFHHLRGLPVAQHRRAPRRVARLGRTPSWSVPIAA